ncbi:mannan-binding lectin serine protease 1 [Platysternon megacephalum]|uniref:Mannan-binding lectin serine protease 1 n=1 Tax=Platysternon megacephalum TaxID=55544 RepID=A0A4D9EE47_9SAUR|nr:mannan-binding lectin serine protease 1 [Platysternon megacephalum]
MESPVTPFSLIPGGALEKSMSNPTITIQHDPTWGGRGGMCHDSQFQAAKGGGGGNENPLDYTPMLRLCYRFKANPMCLAALAPCLGHPSVAICNTAQTRAWGTLGREGQ